MATASVTEPTVRPFLEFRALLRAIGIASDPKKLILASLGLVALAAGWSVLDRLFANAPPRFAPIGPGQELEALQAILSDPRENLAVAMAEPFRVVVSPFVAMFSRGAGLSNWFRSALMAVWAVVVWGVFGGAISRIAVVQAASNGQVGFRSAVRFALGKSVSLIGAPLTPLLGVGIFAGLCALVGLVNRVPWGVGPTIAAFLGFMPLLLGLLMALILVGLAIGWPLMHATVAAEGEDAPDALSRSYSYVNQRLARYLAHVVVSGILGAIGLAVAIGFAAIVLSLADWGVSLGAPDPIPSNDLADVVRSFWPRLVGLLIHAWVYSYFWSSSTIIYLILRRDVDGTPWQDVYLPEQAAESFVGDLATVTPLESPEPIATRVD